MDAGGVIAPQDLHPLGGVVVDGQRRCRWIARSRQGGHRDEQNSGKAEARDAMHAATVSGSERRTGARASSRVAPTCRSALTVGPAVAGWEDGVVGSDGEAVGEGRNRCARCGRPINQSASMSTPTVPGELCSWCLTGHGPNWVEYPEPDWPVGRWLKQSRLFRWMNSGRDG